MEQTPIIPQMPPEGPRPLPPSHFSDEPPKKEGYKSIISTIALLIAAPLVAVILVSFVFQSYEVDGPSMETTLQDGDRLMVLKTGKTWASLFNDPFIPNRGEIIVFDRSDGDPLGGSRQLIKRVIGLPGERVVVQNGNITVYNATHPDGFDPDKAGEYENSISGSTPGNVDITVPANELFVCGDNRANSFDSRSFGTVAADDISGTLALRIFPLSKAGSF